MTYVDLHHTHDQPGVAHGVAHGPAFDAVREMALSTATGISFLVLAAAAAVFSLWLGAGRLVHRLMA